MRFLQKSVASGGASCYLGGMFRQLLIVILVMLGVAAGEGVDYREMGRLIWVNESDGALRALVQWDEERDCAAMGLGGSVWYPAGLAGRADEEFPKLVAFAKAQGVEAPVAMRGAAPWVSADELETDSSGSKEAMHKWLAAHLDVQARFLIARVQMALPRMLRVSKMPAEVQARFEQLSLSPQGLYAMADFLSFMGDGASPAEPAAPGLLQALETLRPGAPVSGAEFARAAAEVLQAQARLTPPRDARAKRALALRLKRCRTYATAFSR